MTETHKLNINDCKGCYTKNMCKIIAYVDCTENNNIGECPCGICLIKSICINMCNDYKQFSTKFHGFKYKMDTRK